MNEELKFLGKFIKKIGGDREGRGSGGGRVDGGVRVDVNAMLGVGGDVGYGGWNRRYNTMYKKVLYNIKKMKKCGGGRGRVSI